ncbi:MAG: hypothetical protein K5790_10505 [Nitrosopumilus sp.]|uniref:hypothetical protein n=1 Tax=Nitrosopumilus sp. TaxID=2024843 RepID=UPI00247D5EF9|nr:hypothetical protein [Nitrosopumilus sp.]MCV0393701.1 hypothetical protein [Nitrosopumilus sp.]
MKVMYRGVRLEEHEVDYVLENGMKYYWNSPEDAITDIFRALERNHKISKLGNNYCIRNFILEASRLNRLQIYATEVKENAESYARATPEIIYETLQIAGVEYKKNINYLNKWFGVPHIVTFCIDSQPSYIEEINKQVGTFISPEFITSIEKVDITKPDPYLEKLRCSVNA